MPSPPKRPLLSRALPNRLKQPLYYRYYRTRYRQWQELFNEAPLTLVSDVAMYDLLPGDEISGSIAFNGFYELNLSQQILKLGREGGLLIDVGANMGYYSLLWAGANPANQVVAFEASPRNIRLLEGNVAKNQLDDRVKIIPKAAGHQTGSIFFDVGADDQTGWGGIAKQATPATINVPMTRLDEELSSVRIDVLKIDVEGADTWILEGCEKLLQAKLIKKIFFEQNAKRMSELSIPHDQAQKLLQRCGYECLRLDNQEEEWLAYPKQD